MALWWVEIEAHMAAVGVLVVNISKICEYVDKYSGFMRQPSEVLEYRSYTIVEMSV